MDPALVVTLCIAGANAIVTVALAVVGWKKSAKLAELSSKLKDWENERDREREARYRVKTQSHLEMFKLSALAINSTYEELHRLQASISELGGGVATKELHDNDRLSAFRDTKRAAERAHLAGAFLPPSLEAAATNAYNRLIAAIGELAGASPLEVPRITAAISSGAEGVAIFRDAVSRWKSSEFSKFGFDEEEHVKLPMRVRVDINGTSDGGGLEVDEVEVKNASKEHSKGRDTHE